MRSNFVKSALTISILFHSNGIHPYYGSCPAQHSFLFLFLANSFNGNLVFWLFALMLIKGVALDIHSYIERTLQQKFSP